MIISPEYTDQMEALREGYRKLIEDHGGRITRSEDWGLRNLSYLIDKHRKGHYLLLNFACSDSKVIDSLQAEISGDNPAMRTLLTRTRMEISAPSLFIQEMERAAEKREEAKV